MQLEKPKLSYLSMAIMLSLGATSNSFAAETQALDEEVETITVTGIRGSLVRAMDLKKSADGIVDAISAEDIGKFPDQNVAESLQRISGVAIDRDGGEGQSISVRGLGPEFNAVLVNGRTMASVSGGRAFSFDTLAAELISGAEVHKTIVVDITNAWLDRSKHDFVVTEMVCITLNIFIYNNIMFSLQ